jgi:hypothetical protein
MRAVCRIRALEGQTELHKRAWEYKPLAEHYLYSWFCANREPNHQLTKSICETTSYLITKNREIDNDACRLHYTRVLCHAAVWVAELPLSAMKVDWHLAERYETSQANTFLAAATYLDMGACVEELVAQGAQPTLTIFGNPLLHASEIGNSNLLKILLRTGNIVLDSWLSVIDLAAKKGHREVLQTLFNFTRRTHIDWQNTRRVFDERSLTPQFFWEILQKTASAGQIDVLHYLLSQGALFCEPDHDPDSDIGIRDRPHWLGRILFAGCTSGQVPVVRMALISGESPKLPQHYHGGFFGAACEGGNVQVLQLLISHYTHLGIPITASLSRALFVAAQKGSVALSVVLIDHGAEIHPSNEFRSHPYLTATRFGQVELLRFLIKRGGKAKVDAKRLQWSIEKAISKGHMECVQILKAHVSG